MALAPDDTLSPANVVGTTTLSPSLQTKRFSGKRKSVQRVKKVTSLTGRPSEFSTGLFGRGTTENERLKPKGSPTKFAQRFFAGVGASLQPLGFNAALAAVQGLRPGAKENVRAFRISTRKLSDEGALIIPNKTRTGLTRNERRQFL